MPHLRSGNAINLHNSSGLPSLSSAGRSLMTSHQTLSSSQKAALVSTRKSDSNSSEARPSFDMASVGSSIVDPEEVSPSLDVLTQLRMPNRLAAFAEAHNAQKLHVVLRRRKHGISNIQPETKTQKSPIRSAGMGSEVLQLEQAGAEQCTQNESAPAFEHKKSSSSTPFLITHQPEASKARAADSELSQIRHAQPDNLGQRKTGKQGDVMSYPRANNELSAGARDSDLNSTAEAPGSYAGARIHRRSRKRLPRKRLVTSSQTVRRKMVIRSKLKVLRDQSLVLSIEKFGGIDKDSDSDKVSDRLSGGSQDSDSSYVASDSETKDHDAHQSDRSAKIKNARSWSKDRPSENMSKKKMRGAAVPRPRHRKRDTMEQSSSSNEDLTGKVPRKEPFIGNVDQSNYQQWKKAFNHFYATKNKISTHSSLELGNTRNSVTGSVISEHCINASRKLVKKVYLPNASERSKLLAFNGMLSKQLGRQNFRNSLRTKTGWAIAEFRNLKARTVCGSNTKGKNTRNSITRSQSLLAQMCYQMSV
mmetsp:Transcript_15897/g.45705  ORF Transcript_15897/g.45705 Transcript_15897/m.45705 type:complete len:533 (-) Transcript_15897:543-2141(-)